MSNNIGKILDKGVNAGQGILNKATGAIQSGFDKFTSLTNTPSLSSGQGGNVSLMFPPDIRSQNADHLPLIEFTAYERNPSPGNINGIKKPGTGFHQIYLPINSNVSFNDAASYNTINLSSIAAKATQAVTETQTSGADLLSSMAAATAAAKETIAAKYIPLGVGDYVALKSRTITNPNTNTTFEGNVIRTFNFNFKLIAKSQQESEIIQKIHETFRYFSYADLNTEDSNLFLSYPCPWTIRFMDMATGQENAYIPGIWSCYLTTVGSTFNSSSNMYFSDNAPLEVDVSLTFQETRVLNRNDMLQIKNDPLRGIINGKPSTILPPSEIAETTSTVGGD